MSNYSNLKSGIQSVIKTNENNEITGQLLQAQLLAMISALGFGYQFMGVATPETAPGTPDAKVFYFAYTPGTYTNFNGIAVTGFCVLKYDTGWSKDDLPSGGGGSYVLPIASAQTLGGVKIGTGLSINAQTGVLSANGGGYTLPIATAQVLGGVKIGTGLSIDPQTGVLSTNGGSSFNGGEITQDLWLHTGNEDYGSKLWFGDKGTGAGLAYISEDSDDHLRIYGKNGVTIAAGEGGSVTIEGLSIALGDLSGVSLSSPSNGQALVFRDGSWKNETIQGGSYTLPIASAQTLGGVKIGSGLSIDAQGVLSANGGSGGTVTSVGLDVPTESGFSVTGSPITSSGTIEISLDSQTKGKVLASPASENGVPTFRVLVASDIPDISGKYVTLDTAQNNISGEKTFTTKPVHIGSDSGLDVNGNAYIDLGDARLKWDAENHSLYVTKRPGSSYAGDINLVVDGDVGGGGVGTGASVKYVNCVDQSAYNNIATKDPGTIYTIGTAPSFSRVYLGTLLIYGS